MPHARLLRTALKCARRLIAVDGGLSRFHKLRTAPHVVIGDLDSATLKDLNWARTAGTRIQSVPDQNSSDIEKAFAYCRSRQFRSVVLAGVDGDRPDHFLHAVSKALSTPALDITFLFSNAIGLPMRGRVSRKLNLPEGAVVSWLGCPRAEHCSLTGAAWPLTDRTLELGAYQSLSNRVAKPPLKFNQQSGKSLIVIPVL